MTLMSDDDDDNTGMLPDGRNRSFAVVRLGEPDDCWPTGELERATGDQMIELGPEELVSPSKLSWPITDCRCHLRECLNAFHWLVGSWLPSMLN